MTTLFTQEGASLRLVNNALEATCEYVAVGPEAYEQLSAKLGERKPHKHLCNSNSGL